MSDFAVYAPRVERPVIVGLFSTRPAVPRDADALAAVMAARGGTAEEHVDHARKMLARLDVLLIAEKDDGEIAELRGDRVHRR